MDKLFWRFGIFYHYWLSVFTCVAISYVFIDLFSLFFDAGFGENSRVLDWVFRRCDGEDVGEKTAIGFVPKDGTINLKGTDVTQETMAKLRTTDKEFLLNEVKELKHFFEEQINDDLPKEMWDQLKQLEERANAM